MTRRCLRSRWEQYDIARRVCRVVTLRMIPRDFQRVVFVVARRWLPRRWSWVMDGFSSLRQATPRLLFILNMYSCFVDIYLRCRCRCSMRTAIFKHRDAVDHPALRTNRSTSRLNCDRQIARYHRGFPIIRLTAQCHAIRQPRLYCRIIMLNPRRRYWFVEDLMGFHYAPESDGMQTVFQEC